MKLNGKIFINGDIVAVTGLHIGGSKASLDIGGVDLNVIKTPHGVPFIPGSSLKGKLRSLLARLNGSLGINNREVDKDAGEKSDEDFPIICEIFGLPSDEEGKKTPDGKKKETKGKVTRLIVRDADLDEEHFKKTFPDGAMEFEFSDVKWENSINRKTGTALNPRQLERVPAGARFSFEMVYDDYDDGKTADHLDEIRIAMRMLEGDYLGGQGSRGYGKIRFENVAFTAKKLADYAAEDNKAQPYNFKY